MRDYTKDMRKVVADMTGDEPYHVRTIAVKIVQHLRENDSSLLTGWLDMHAEDLLAEEINKRDRSQRAHTRAVVTARRFGDAVDEAERGDPTALASFLDVRYPVDGDIRKPLKDLTANELLFVADAYTRRANANAMTATFFRTLAKKVGDDRVSDHFDDDTLNTMWSSIVHGTD